ncbi:S-formylglutathione hydrolase [Agrobacterium rubi]|uniref:S-formylglutathione hydrolase n=1 Tax=Agrobacterium rubi TaxID=28099 RepID=A0AAE7QYF4_9HYPH|nr:S-formylglutathione hydrolase [Agrobacterium rubi]NTE86373.1 S-formylglutathione hydrolase [Agrobacterium rubi]NTF02305.1 S-formylglutathione hydrolase [Agrobacterium rubi]NTF36549.1 S-formylglutathione hydrolase [Agrobacterium rubi]OCJ55798.1 S-formylglutathione hydrolase [Agrobacterium rubi]QTF99012.1 S-formylglutathione hydrolase [Agrobacterium rubi]
MKIISQNTAFGGMQGVFAHDSEVTNCEMTLAVYVPPKAIEEPCPVVWYLSGLTCTHANVMDKGEYRRMASELGLIVVCPDTSPRGNDVADELTNWQMGKGAGFYLDATEKPWADHYQMYSYITQELPALVSQQFRVDMSRQGIFGHSMGGHGAMTIALKNPDRFKSCSAFAPIVAPSLADWSAPAFEKYLGEDKAAWRQYDACALVEDGARFPEFLIDQGKADNFLETGLRPWLFEEAIKGTEIDLTLRMHERYDHSYYFISTFMDDHLKWHAKRLG